MTNNTSTSNRSNVSTTFLPTIQKLPQNPERWHKEIAAMEKRTKQKVTKALVEYYAQVEMGAANTPATTIRKQHEEFMQLVHELALAITSTRVAQETTQVTNTTKIVNKKRHLEKFWAQQEQQNHDQQQQFHEQNQQKLNELFFILRDLAIAMMDGDESISPTLNAKELAALKQSDYEKFKEKYERLCKLFLELQKAEGIKKELLLLYSYMKKTLVTQPLIQLLKSCSAPASKPEVL